MLLKSSCNTFLLSSLDKVNIVSLCSLSKYFLFCIIDDLNNEHVYAKPIVTQLALFTSFYKAEDYHQDYYNQNKQAPYCRLVIQPKLEKFEKLFKDRLKK